MNAEAPFRSRLRFAAAALLVLGFAGAARAETVYVDVRTIEEHREDAIPGDLNIPVDQLDPAALASRVGKEADIVVYCQAGRRAAQASQKLSAAGFTHVTNGGGIDDVRRARAAASSSKPHGTGERGLP